MKLSFVQEKGNIDLAIRYYLIAIEVCMHFLPYNVFLLFMIKFLNLFVNVCIANILFLYYYITFKLQVLNIRRSKVPLKLAMRETIALKVYAFWC